MTKILHVITDTDRGGAEIVLERLLPELKKKGYIQTVVCLSPVGEIGKEITASGFIVKSLEMKRGQFSIIAFRELIRIIQDEKPDLIQTWMYHADFFTSLATHFIHVPVIWGIHNSTLGENSSFKTRMIMHCLARMSASYPARIISCSKNAAEVHEQLGYRQDIMRYIPNGFDTEKYQPDLSKRREVRRFWDISDSNVLVGSISRYDQQKNIPGLIDSWKIMAEKNRNLTFLLAGKDMDNQNHILIDLISSAGLLEKVKLLGIRQDVPAVLNALDLFMLASNSGEAFPLVIGEAMSCGIICVGTDVGDVRFIIADCGKVVQPNDPAALAQAGLDLLALPDDESKKLKLRSRSRVFENFTLSKMAEGYDAVYRELES